MQRTSSLPTIGISACLAGQAVRYDGHHKYTPLLINTLSKSATLLPICPETTIGLPTPRNKIQLTYQNGRIRVLDTVNTEIDLTDSLQQCALTFLKHHQLSGLVLQEKSPSCGIDNCKVFSDNGTIMTYASGVFAATIIKALPELPVCCAVDLQKTQDLVDFIQQVQNYRQKIEYCA